MNSYVRKFLQFSLVGTAAAVFAIITAVTFLLPRSTFAEGCTQTLNFVNNGVPVTYTSIKTTSTVSVLINISACPALDNSGAYDIWQLREQKPGGGQSTVVASETKALDGAVDSAPYSEKLSSDGTYIFSLDYSTTGPTDFKQVASIQVIASPTAPNDAGTGGTPIGGSGGNPGSAASGPLSPVETINNPVASETFIGLAFTMMKYLLGVLAGLAMVFIMIGAIQLTVSRGNPEGVTKGKDTILWALAGLAVALLSFSVLAIVQNLINP